jgi:hypothetical protein
MTPRELWGAFERSYTMDLKHYEDLKFQLAEIIRSGELVATGAVVDSNRHWEVEQPWRDVADSVR